MGERSREANAAPNDEKNSECEAVTVAVNSGAYRAAGLLSAGAHSPVKPTEASSNGRLYTAANGIAIRNRGQRAAGGKEANAQGAPVTMPIQVADVTKFLGSAREAIEAGRRLVFD